MIDLFPFSGFIVGVLGLGDHGLVTARALKLSGAEVWAWDHDENRREKAQAEGIPLVDLNACDAREIISLVIEPDIAHGLTDCDDIVTAVRNAGGEVISDAELLVRTQRDAAYLGITGAGDDAFFCSLITQMLEVAGKDIELGGTPERAMLGLHPLDLGGMYVLLMPPKKLDMTVSITFDTAVWLGAVPFMTDEELGNMRKIFHRQTKPRTAIISVDDPVSCEVYETLKDADEQIVVPISGKNRVPGGVYIEDSMLIDDTNGEGVPVTNLGEYDTYCEADHKRLAAFAYTTALSVGIEPRVAMACLQGF